MVRPADPLDRQVKALLLAGAVHLDRLQVGQQRAAVVPGHLRRIGGHVGPLGGREGDDLHVLQTKLLPQLVDLFLDLLEPGLAVVHQVHLVHREHKGADAHEGADAGVAAGLDQNALGGVHQDHRQVRKGGTHRHVAGVLLVARGVRHDEAPPVGGKVPVGHVDGDALLPLGHKAVQQQGVVQLAPPGAHLTVQLQGLLLVGVQELGVVQDVADQGGFAVVHAPAGDKFQQAVCRLILSHQKYPSRFRFSMLASPPSLSMTRLVRSEVTALRVSSMMASRVSAWDSTPPVRG